MNQKRTSREIISRKVNAVVKSLQTLHTTLRNNHEDIQSAEWEKMKQHIRDKTDEEFKLIDPLFEGKEEFKL
jgi:hypothetical protein